ncbi:TonB-dependent receptor [Aromatoleum toluvorans]|uniref:TonB-dependent receptor n=1 Tax=Aromatoleum toluvorans TaxID=92002 RepID=A0ABX1PYM2_9RHOO|nr:TonB-dependent receptor [Aromatoleum toluvorans]NMG43340.1 TonB-dependent receptor [Aromatoleum toluvorans]
MNIRLSAAAVAVAAAFPFANTAFAADEVTGETVIVTATRQPTRSDELLADTTVVTRNEIERAGHSTLSQILSATPGVFVTDGGLPGKDAAVFVRGTNRGHVLLFIDGMPVTSATLGQAPFELIPASDIERIEILRGPASALYGSEAIGGVVQVFTRRGQGPVRPQVALRYGSHNTRDAQANISGGGEQLSFALSASKFKTDGINSTRGPLSNFDDDGYERESMSGSLQWRLAPGHELGVTLLKSDDENHTDGDLNFDNRTKNDILSWSVYSRNRLSDFWTSTLRVGESANLSDSHRVGAIDTFDTRTRLIAWQNDLRTTWGDWIVGLEEQRQNVDTSGELVVDSRTFRSGFAGWTGSFGANRLQANIRRDDVEHIGAENTWSLGYGYQFSDSIRGFASMGTAFKAPSFNDLYFPTTCFPIFGCFGGNPDLKPESSRNREIGLAWEEAGQEAKIVYFLNRIKDLIVFENTPENVGKAKIAGVTASYAGRLDRWHWNLAVDVLDPRDEDTDNILRRRARERLVAGLDYTAGQWTVGGQWSAVGARYEDSANTQRMGGYGLVDLFAQYRIDRDWTLDAQIKNAGDKDYALALGFQNTVFATAGRTAFIGVRYAPR